MKIVAEFQNGDSSSQVVNIYPLQDTVRHITHKAGCWCIPQIKRMADGFIYKHHEFAFSLSTAERREEEEEEDE